MKHKLVGTASCDKEVVELCIVRVRVRVYDIVKELFVARARVYLAIFVFPSISNPKSKYSFILLNIDSLGSPLLIIGFLLKAKV
jgi:hypothetical protein